MLPLLALAALQSACPTPSTGADLVIGDISSAQRLGTAGALDVYGYGITLCNVGDAALPVEASTPLHPVVGQNLYRVHDGRFEQLGMSWLWHAFSPLQQSLCCPCSPGGFGDLGTGCSDARGLGSINSQASLGPRSEVDPTWGIFPMPFGQSGVTGPTEFKRLQVAQSDLSSTAYPAARFLAEAFVIDRRDANQQNGANNASWRELSRSGFTDRLSPTGPTERGEPAILAWPRLAPDTTVQRLDILGQGTFFVGCHVKDEGNGTWTYSYAVHNLDSRRGVRGLYVPVDDAVVTADGMSFPRSHSGEPYSNLPWTGSAQTGVFRWFTESFSVNPDANAIRFGTTYSFWFTADRPPGPRVVDLELFTPGGPSGAQLIVNAPVADQLTSSSTCTSTPNSTGAVTTLQHADVDLVGRSMVLRVGAMPLQQFGLVATSLSTDLVPFPGGSSGTLCLGGSIGRLVGGSVFNSNNVGAANLDVDLDAIPTPSGLTSIQPGETRHFQAWHRDATPAGATSNFSSLLSLTFP